MHFDLDGRVYEVSPDVIALVKTNKKIQAIKLLRQTYPLDLFGAKKLADKVQKYLESWQEKNQEVDSLSEAIKRKFSNTDGTNEEFTPTSLFEAKLTSVFDILKKLLSGFEKRTLALEKQVTKFDKEILKLAELQGNRDAFEELLRNRDSKVEQLEERVKQLEARRPRRVILRKEEKQ